MSPKMGKYTLEDDIARMAVHVADADAHHSEEIPDGRLKSAAVTFLSIPGYVGRGFQTAVPYTKDKIYYSPIYVRTPITIDQVVIEVMAAAGAGEKCRIVIYTADVDWQPGALVVASAQIAIDAIAVVTTAIALTTLQEGRYLIAITLEGNASLRVIRYDQVRGFATTFGVNTCVKILTADAAYAALPDPGTAWDAVVESADGIYQPVLLRVSVP